MIEIACAECGAAYLAHRRSRLYCSKICMSRACARRRLRPSRKLPLRSATCAYCAKIFETTRPKQRFCSRPCLHNDWVRANRIVVNKRAAACMQKRRQEKPERVREIHAKHRAKPESRKHAANKSRDWHHTNREYANPRRAMRLNKTLTHSPWHVCILGASLRAKKRNMPFDLTTEWAAARWTGRCELTNIAFQRSSGKIKLLSASLDKIDPALGYVQTNCRFILFAVNVFKNNGNDAQMYAIAEALLENRERLISAIR